MTVPAFVIISLASKQFDRYVIVVMPFVALAVGLGSVHCWHWHWSRRGCRSRPRPGRPC